MEAQIGQRSDPDRVDELCRLAFGNGRVAVDGLTDVNRGRGAFSVVLQAELRWLDQNQAWSSNRDQARGIDRASGGSGPDDPERPSSVVAKLPVPGPNGEAAATSGAYRREGLAYRHLLPLSPIATPRAYAIDEPGDRTCALLLEDLTDRRTVDQLDGLGPDDAVGVAETLARFHHHWADADRLARLEVRRNTLAGLAPEPLHAGLTSLAADWGDVLDEADRRVYASVVAARPTLVGRFEESPVTLCHGDPRADNLVFDVDDRPLLFDWQQMAVQLAEADLAWLAATSRLLRSDRTRQYAGLARGSLSPERTVQLPGRQLSFLRDRGRNERPCGHSAAPTPHDRMAGAGILHEGRLAPHRPLADHGART
jgi:hypothetical protein